MSSANEILTINTLPSPKGAPIVGHLRKFNAANKHNVLEGWVKESGEIFKISLLGKKFIVSADPEINSYILRNRPDKFRRFYKINEIMEEMGIVGVFNAEGEEWKQHRKLTAEALNAKNVNHFFPILKKVTQRLFQRWEKISASNQIIDVQKEMVRYTVDITTAIAFGYDMNTIEKEGDILQDHLEKIFPMINQRITSPIPMWRYVKSKKDKEFEFALSEIEKFVNECIASARTKLHQNPELRNHPSNFLEALLVEQEKNQNFTDKEVFGNVFTILLAGEDTTSNSISWTLYYLTQNPEVFQKVRAEANRVFSNNICVSKNEEIEDLKYTEAVVMEAMRLKPVTPTLFMQALEDITIKNLQIKNGMTVMMQNKVAQTKEEYFSNAESFIPERWLQGGCPMHANHSPNVMRAFGSGSRFCPGKHLAMQELKICISMICKNFNLTLAVNPEEVKEVFAFTMYPENLKVKLGSLNEK